MPQRDTPRVSAIIPAYNYAQYVGAAIDSVLAQTARVHELIVVDDGSTDGTPEILARYQDVPFVKIVRQENGGLAAARNRGGELATGDLLAFLDADDIWLPAKLERQVAHILQHPEAGLVHCGVRDIDAAGNLLDVHLDGSEGDAHRDLLLFRRGVLGGGSGFMVPRRVFVELRGFDTRLSTSADWDFFYRVSARYPVGFVPEVLLHYRKHGGNMHQRVEVMEADMLHAFAKAFANGTPDPKLRREAYGKLFMILAGSYYSTRQPGGCLRNIAKSLWMAPRNAAYVFGFPARRWRQR